MSKRDDDFYDRLAEAETTEYYFEKQLDVLRAEIKNLKESLLWRDSELAMARDEAKIAVDVLVEMKPYATKISLTEEEWDYLVGKITNALIRIQGPNYGKA